MSNRHRYRRYRKPAPAPVRTAGDAPDAPDDTIVVGRVVRGHGLDGSLKIRSYSDNPERFRAGEPLTVSGESHAVVSGQTLTDGHILLRLAGVNDAHAARKLTGQWLFAPIDSAPALPPGEYYHYQLVGLPVITDQGETLGAVREILTTGSNDVYVVASDAGEEILLPAISQVIRRIDLSAGRMLVHLIDGLR